MLFMNEHEIRQAVNRFQSHKILGPATRFLEAYMEEVDAHSDGWPYWSAPVKAAKQLMQMIQNPDGVTISKYIKALTPIRAFYTRHGNKAGMRFPKEI